MLIYDSIDAINQAEAILAVEQDVTSPAGWAEADWGYRLRGEGLPGGKHGWLLTFIYDGVPFGLTDRGTGTLIAYEIKDNTKTGRVGVVRRDWKGSDDNEWISKVQSSPSWNLSERATRGEDDIERLDDLLPGTKL